MSGVCNQNGGTQDEPKRDIENVIHEWVGGSAEVSDEREFNMSFSDLVLSDEGGETPTFGKSLAIGALDILSNKDNSRVIQRFDQDLG
jgi:hypothetical protein